MYRPFPLLLVVCSSLSSSLAFAHGGQILEQLPCPVEEPMGLAACDNNLFISDMATRSIVRFDPCTAQILERIPAQGFLPTGIACSQGTLFLADRRQDFMARMRLGKNDHPSPIPYYERWATGLVHDGQSLWVVDARSAKLHRIDPVDGTTIESFDAPDKHPTGIAFDGRMLWVADHGKDSLYRVDPSDGKVVTILPSPGPYPSALAMHQGSLWVADYQSQQLFRVSLPHDEPYLEDMPRRVRVSYEVVYRVRGTGAVTHLRAALAVPEELPGQHLLDKVTFEPQPTRMTMDRWGQPIALFEREELKAGTTFSIRWTGDFLLYRVRFPIDPDRVRGATLPAQLDAYLQDDKKYDLGAQSLARLVEEVTHGKTSYYDRARAIYEHLARVIKYDRSGGWNNAATVLARGTGSCSEYTFALVGMLRRAGIPARYAGAVSERGDEASFDDVYHRWAEAYMPGYGWVPMDANAGFGETPAGKAEYFGGRSNRHVVTTRGGGASEWLDWTYNNHTMYEVQGDATLEEQSLARYRPLADTNKDPVLASAPRVNVPRLTEPIVDPPAKPTQSTSFSGDPWMAAIALLLAAGFGIAVGRGFRTIP
ncbi:MAG TPA: transglutaminase domain-containing protein [Polyangiaceae bacterium]|nr:MAG: Virginiamycin B lyase [Deltaproteobacteria bacterium ADurb.Bin207]HNZ20545.1 transglutaminase domain-containing protein [Polyangiaceae bacterium]HOE47259.1 transglutaminase domain-containing protein [Polyangiaceae bacterium]HOG99075.1 transglutaminase domain-containing protein [Polyangiaceae bacterium]HOR33474.1 transglutaminase domain-containing protein [Polyangiaceae bacterium]